MIDLYYWPTPNGWKITIMLAECGLSYRLMPLDIVSGKQFHPAFLALNPNHKMPAIVDHDPPGGGDPLVVFESGAILLYLAEKTGRFLPRDLAGRFAVTEWLMWQMSGLGPMQGQSAHFSLYAAEKVPAAIERFGREVQRLYGVLDAQLGRTGACVAGDYSVADIAIFPWAIGHKKMGVDADALPHFKRWFAALRQREKVQEGLAVGRDLGQLKLKQAAPATIA